jgi:HK97 family phage portal protein
MAIKFRTRFSRAMKVAFGAVAGLFSGYGGQGGRGWRMFSPGSQYDYEAQAGDLWRNSAVAACLRVLRTNFPEPELEVARGPKPEDEAIEGHGLARLIRRPNGYYSRFVLWAATILSLVVDGNAYWLKVRSRAGKVVQLWWVPHWMIEPRYPADGSVYLTHYVYLVNGRQIPLRVEDVVHFRQGIDPRNDRLGLSDLKAAVREICGDNEAAGYAAATLRNSGVPTVVITPAEDGGTFAEGQPDDIRSQFRERFTGEGRGEPLVTDSLKVTKIGFSPKELTLGDLPDRFEDRIASLTGVNPMVAGLTSGASHKTFANYGEARRALYEDTIVPTQRCVAEELTDQLLPDFPAPDGAIVRWSYRGVLCLRENENDLADRAAMLFEKKLATQNESRLTCGLPATPGGNKFADGSTPEEGPQKPPPPPSPATDGQEGKEEVDDEGSKSLRAEAIEVLKLARERMGSA